MTNLSQEYDGLSISISFSYEKREFVHKVVHEKGKFQYIIFKKKKKSILYSIFEHQGRKPNH